MTVFMDPDFAEAGRNDGDDPSDRVTEPRPAFEHAYLHPGPQNCRDYMDCHERAYYMDGAHSTGGDA